MEKIDIIKPIKTVEENNHAIRNLRIENAQIKEKLIEFCVKEKFFHCLNIDLKKLQITIR